jgi:hypothetical protein
MKLIDHIKEHCNGSVKVFADDNNYHVTQVYRFIAQDAYYGGGEPYFKKYLKVKANENTKAD